MIWVRGLALLVMAWSAVVLVMSALPMMQLLPTLIVIAPVVLAVPVFVITLGKVIVEVGPGTRALRPLWRLLRETMPLWLLATSWLAFAGFWLILMTAINGLQGGTPQVRGGAYVANNHGVVTVISKSEYLRAKAREQRIPPAAAGMFCVLSLVTATALVRRDTQRRAMSAPPPTAG
jgi:hypothetical protein